MWKDQAVSTATPICRADSYQGYPPHPSTRASVPEMPIHGRQFHPLHPSATASFPETTWSTRAGSFICHTHLQQLHFQQQHDQPGQAISSATPICRQLATPARLCDPSFEYGYSHTPHTHVSAPLREVLEPLQSLSREPWSSGTPTVPFSWTH